MTSLGGTDAFVLKLDVNGNLLWAVSVGGGTGDDYFSSVAVDASGNTYICGTFRGTVDFDPGAGTSNLTSNGDTDICLLKLDPDGNLVWARSVGASGDDSAASLDIDSGGNVCVTGSYRNTVDFDPGAGTANLTSAGSYDVFVLKLDNAGNYVWAKSVGGTGDDNGVSLTVDDADDVHVTGRFNALADFDPGAGSASIGVSGGYDAFVLKLGSAGNYVWAGGVGGGSNENGLSIKTDASSHVFVAGYFESTADFDPSGNTVNIVSNGSTDAFLLELDSDGNYVRVDRTGGSGEDRTSAITLAYGAVHQTGWFSQSVDFAPGPLQISRITNGAFDFFVDRWYMDSDGDGLSDADEVDLYGSDPNDADTDGDGADDAFEVNEGTNPLSPASYPTLLRGTPTPLNTYAEFDEGNDLGPSLTTDGAGNWVAVWHSNENEYFGGNIGSDFDIVVSRSSNNGVTWTAPGVLNTNAASDSGDDSAPKVSTDGAGNWMAVWCSTDSLSGTIGTDYDILVSRSTDNGTTWTAPAALNSNANSDTGADIVPQVTSDSSGNWAAIWFSTENLGGTIGTDFDIFVSKSSDNGTTWSTPAALNTNASSDVADDQHPRLATNETGDWIVVWFARGTPGDDYDIFYSRSTDNATTWAAPAALNTNAASDSGYDLYPRISTDRAGNWLAIWFSDDPAFGGYGDIDTEIVVARSTDNGATWSNPYPLNAGAFGEVGHDLYPDLATDEAGNWIAVWQYRRFNGYPLGLDLDVMVSRSTDYGLTWSTPVPLNTNAQIDWGHDFDARVATDCAGHWVGAWVSNDTLDGTIGSDHDILFTTWTLDSAVATPQISPASGSYSGTVVVSMSTATSGAQIRYTLNGSDPTTSSTLYTGAFILTQSATVKARAFKAGMADSFVATASYTLVNPPTLVYPSASGITLTRGATYDIQWTGFTATNVTIELWKTNALYQRLVASTANDGSHSVFVPLELPTASDYYMKVRSTSNANEVDGSNFFFTISGSTVPLVEYPSAPDLSLAPGQTYTVLWAGFTATNVQIELWKTNALYQTLFASTANDGSQAWTVPTGLPTATDYYLKVRSTTNPNEVDGSNNFFRIGPAVPPTVVFPTNSGITLSPGQMYLLRWAGFASSTVKLELWKFNGVSDALYSVINASTPNDNTEYWTVPTNLPTANNYYIKVRGNQVSEVDGSNWYMTIEAAGSPMTLTNGVTVYYLSGSQNSEQLFKFTVPSGMTSLKFKTTAASNSTGDGNLYVKLGSAPTVSTYDQRSIGVTCVEEINVSTPAAGDYYVLIHGNSAFSGMHLFALTY